MTLRMMIASGLVFAAGCIGGSPDSGAPADDDDGALPPGKADGPGTGGGSGALAGATASKILNVQYLAQETGYWCGPASTRIALSARIAPPTQQTLANQLPTTTNGTDRIDQVTTVLNNYYGGPRYDTMQMPNDPPRPAERDRLWRDIALGIESNHPVVANIVAPATNHPPGYPNRTIYHYFTVIGYNPATTEVYIADPANFNGNNHYWLTLDKLASLIPPKGYSYYRCGAAMTKGEIDRKYRALGGCNSVLGAALTEETATPDGAGRYSVFQNGSVYWSQATGAFEVHGAIRDKWAAVGWEAGILGYPTSDETTPPDGVGRYSVFQNGSIYWTPDTGAHEVHGVIRDKYAELGWEASRLGYPTSDEYAVAGGKRTDFQHGAIEWTAATGATTVTYR